MAAHRPKLTGRERGPSPWEGEVLHPLTRCQIDDRLQELGDVYAQTSNGGEAARAAFLRRLAAAVRRPGFALVIAGSSDPTGLAYGFPVRGDGSPWWDEFDVCLPPALLRLAAAGRLFAIPEIVVPYAARRQHQGRDWNLARRLQGRLLADHGAALGLTLVSCGNSAMQETLRSWGWRYVPGAGPGAYPPAQWRALALSP